MVSKKYSITEIGRDGHHYYTLQHQKGVCEKCRAQGGAIYRVLNARDGETLPPFHPNCNCRIAPYAPTRTDRKQDPFARELEVWMAADQEPDKAKRLAILRGFYPLDDMPDELIYKAMEAAAAVLNIRGRAEVFAEALGEHEAKKKPEVLITAEQLAAFGWRRATQDEADRLNAAFAHNQITSRESIIQFMAIAKAESDGGVFLEMGSDAYFAGKLYDKNERGAGYLQVTWRETHLQFLESIGDNFKGEDTASYIAENYPLEVSVWFWANGYKTFPWSHGINEFIDTKYDGSNGDEVYLMTAYYVGGMPNEQQDPDDTKGYKYFNRDINATIEDQTSYQINKELHINGRSYWLSDRWEVHYANYKKASEIW